MDASQGKDNPTKEPRFNEERSRIEKLFRKYAFPFMDNVENPKIISIGSGHAMETGGLLRIFPRMHFLGIDIGEKSARDGRMFNDDLIGDIEFRNQDIHDLKIETEGPWDLVLMRHPQVEGSPEAALADIYGRVGDTHRAEIFSGLATPHLKTEGTKSSWEKVIERSADVMAEDGVLYISTWFPFEIDRVRKMLERNPRLNTVMEEENKTIKDSFGNDKHIIVVKKK